LALQRAILKESVSIARLCGGRAYNRSMRYFCSTGGGRALDLQARSGTAPGST
jgi:hypothetical protein